ncbi:microtubule nucleation factor SSNA1-like [Rhea pennata]|uniref:microtubule nucleation factor SSNA1-like n=1 Tax=Rhea pennata TaxID=8795 RepID=UPI002E2637E0
MSRPDAALEGLMKELGEGMAELRARRDELTRLIQGEEEERSRLQGEIWVLTEKLARTNESLARKVATRNDFDRTIAETEAAYGKPVKAAGLRSPYHHLLPWTSWQGYTDCPYCVLPMSSTSVSSCGDSGEFSDLAKCPEGRNGE